MAKRPAKKSKVGRVKQAFMVKKAPRRAPVNTKNLDEFRSATIEQAQKYKYPFQQMKHKILLLAAVVVTLALAAFAVFSYWTLYLQQDLSSFYYIVTKTLPLPVAQVDGQAVKYSDYMRRVRASVHYMTSQENRDLSTEDGQRELNYIKRVSLDEAEKAAFAAKIAREQNLAVPNASVQENIKRNLQSANGTQLSERAFESSIWGYYGWDMGDYRRAVYERLLLKEAMFAVDAAAAARANSVEQSLSADASVDAFVALAKEHSDDEQTKESGGDAGWVSVESVDNHGLIAAAKELEKDQTSPMIKGLDAYYIIQLIEKNDKSVRFRQIKIALREFGTQFAALRDQGKLREYIEIQEEQ